MRTLSKPFESRVAEACEAYRTAEKPNIANIARQYGIARETLCGRVKLGRQAKSTVKPVNYALESIRRKL